MIFPIFLFCGWLILTAFIFTALNNGGVDQPILALGSAILAAVFIAFVGAAV